MPNRGEFRSIIFCESTRRLIQNRPLQRIIVDERERPSGVPDELRSLGAPIEYRVLDVADYVVGSYAVERKSVRDFVSSLYVPRLFYLPPTLRQASQLV